ncbi:MAG TPA: rod-binding protein [Alphaproteobacteria bacterium]|nr:chemotactic signal-response protein chel [Rhodospirillaceae bacterium]HRJ12602.1 rod-binding protein [Alphaproteobacteria bacterium]
MTDINSSAALPPAAGADAFLAKPPLRPLDARDWQGAKDSKEFDKVFEDYEAVYMSQMLSHMYAGVEVDPMFGGGPAEETMRSLLINEYGKMMAQRGGIGLADAMKKQMLEMQEQEALQQISEQNPAADVAAIPDESETP